MSIATFSGIALTVYLIIFGVIFICTEASFLDCRKWFYFLNFGWGKGIANIFIACIMLGSGAAVLWLDVLVGVYMILLSLWLPVITILYFKEERTFVDKYLLEILNSKANKED
jgi:hypothetical protein